MAQRLFVSKGRGFPVCRDVVGRCVQMLAVALVHTQHMYREHNKRADALATQGIQCGSMVVTFNSNKCRHVPRFIRGHFDGGAREGVGGAGYVVEVATEFGRDQAPIWERAL